MKLRPGTSSTGQSKYSEKAPGWEDSTEGQAGILPRSVEVWKSAHRQANRMSIIHFLHLEPYPIKNPQEASHISNFTSSCAEPCTLSFLFLGQQDQNGFIVFIPSHRTRVQRRRGHQHPQLPVAALHRALHQRKEHVRVQRALVGLVQDHNSQFQRKQF